jgi:transcriptional regulator GlxA family with amidase domain
LIDSPRDTEMAWVTLPLAWFMQWGLDESFSRRLLRGELIVEPNAGASAADDALLSRWAADYVEKSGESRRIMAIEVEARLRRLAQAVGRRSPSRAGSGLGAGGGQVERLARYVGQHYDDSNLSVGRIAEAVGLHPNYAMNLFKRGCGMSLWEYLTRLRVSHAQRLLLTSDWKVQRVALESGFGSASRFYEAFGRVCRRSPREYRRSVRT